MPNAEAPSRHSHTLARAVAGAVRACALLGAVVALAGCPDQGIREGERSRSYSPSGKSTVVVLDVSGSMTTYDPDKLSVEGTQLLAALVDDGDNLAAVKFSSDARVIAPMRTVATPASRREFCGEVAGVQRTGSTNYVAALQRAREALEAVNAPKGATIIFMTDGEHNTGVSREDVLAQVTQLRAKGWKVYALGYGPEARQSDLLTQLATRTGGALYLAGSPKELLLSYIKIMEELQGLLIADRIRPARLFPGTSRLLYIVLKGSPGTKISRVTREGRDVPLESADTYHYPGPGESSRAFEVVRVGKPPAGLWNGAVEGPYEVGLVLQDAPFEYGFLEGMPRREQPEGQPVRIGFFVRGDAVKEVEKSSRVEASVTTPDGRKIATLNLEPAPAPDGRTLAWVGEFTPKLAKPGVPETHAVSARFLYREGDVQWTHDSSVAYRLVPPPESGLSVNPRSVDLGVIFAGETSAEVPVTVDARGQAGARVNVQASAGVNAQPGTLEGVTGKPQQVRISATPPEDATAFSGTVTFSPAEGGQDDATSAVVGVTARVVRLRAPSAVTLGDVLVGETGSAPVAISGDDPRVETPALEGPGGAKLAPRLVDKDGKRVYAVDVPKGTPPGEYKSTIDVTVGGARKRVPVTMTVVPAAARLSGLPEKIGLSYAGAGKIKAEQTYDVSLDSAEACDVAITVSDLVPPGGAKGRIPLAREVSAKLEGADGGKLAGGAATKLRVSVSSSSDVASGTYAGTAKVTVKGPDGRASVKEIPISLEVTR